MTYAETSELGRTLPRLLAERGALVGSVSITGDVESCDPKTGEWSVGSSIIQARIRLALESGRLVAVNGLVEGEPLLRDLENLDALPESGPARELANAAAIAVWVGDRHSSNGPWASSKAPPIGSEAAKYFEERDAVCKLAEEERAASSRGGRLRSMLPRRGRAVNR